MQDSLFFIQNLVFALLLGGIIGLEREKKYKKEHLMHEFGGIRTMSLSAVLGYLVYTLFGTSVALFSVFSAGFILLVAVAYLQSARIDQKSGATTEIAALFVYLIGVMMGMDKMFIATIVTLTVLLLLHFKEKLHQFAHKVEREELYDTIKFIAVVFVVLPLLPNEPVDPYGLINPYVIWLVVVLISTISFLSYVAIKWLGARKGIGLSGFLGGLISSTAVSMSFSQMSKKSRVTDPFVFGVLIACSAMFFRVLIEVFVLNPALLPHLLTPMLVMGVSGGLLSLYFWLNKRRAKMMQKAMSSEQLHLSSPFELWSAIKFGIFFVLLLILSAVMGYLFGEEGLYLTAIISGLVDVDAITVSMANLSREGAFAAQTAASAVVLAAISNTLVKAGIVFFFGSKLVGRRVLCSLLFVGSLGIATLFFNTSHWYGFIGI